MQSSQTEHLKSLLGTNDVHILAQDRGGNSKVFCAEAANKKWAIKSYPPYAPNQRDRLEAESTAYKFLNSQGIDAVPTFKAICPTERWLIIDWIDGALPHTYSTSDIEQAITFIREVAKLNTLPEAKNLPQAAEACLSLEIIIKQIEQRLQRLENLPDKDPALVDFLTNDFKPTFSAIQTQAREGYVKHQMNPSEELASQNRSLIPADFGFHNALRDTNGKLYFFDFDYFGWDDPVKLLADILWHPKMTLSSAQQQQFIEGIAKVYQNDTLFLTRFQLTKPLFGLRWALILLNEFIPAFWQNRQHAEAHQNQDDAKILQLKRAKGLLKALSSYRPKQ